MTAPDHEDGVGPLYAAECAFAETFLHADLAEVERHWNDVEQPGLVVGMAPGPRTSKRLPMFPWPETSAGGRLLAFSGMTVGAYLGRLRRANLCDGAFRAPEARWRATELVQRFRAEREPRVRFVLCGRRVAEAFDLADAGWFTRASIYGVETVLIPHPSGRCREYSDPAARRRAGEAIRWAARVDGDITTTQKEV